MKVTGYKTHKIGPGESLFEIIPNYISHIPDNSVLAITSKIVSLSQNRVIKKEQVPNKLELIQKEADFYLEGNYIEKYGVCITIKNGLLVPTAGIDESNSNGYYVLYPEDIQREAATLWYALKERYQCRSLGILITDSHTTPLRRGVTGIALGWCGFKPLNNYINTPDIYGNLLKMTQVNTLDALAGAAVFMMGEGQEQTPLAVLSEVPHLQFADTVPSTEEVESLTIPLKEDLYAPLLTGVNWKSHTDRSYDYGHDYDYHYEKTI